MQLFLPFSFSFSEKNKSYVISSFVETKGEAMIAKTAVEFVEYPWLVLQKLPCIKKRKPPAEMNIKPTENNYFYCSWWF